MLFKQCALALVAVLGSVTCSAEFSQVVRPPTKAHLLRSLLRRISSSFPEAVAMRSFDLPKRRHLADGQLPGTYDP